MADLSVATAQMASAFGIAPRSVFGPRPDQNPTGRPYKHRTFPWAWWLARCKCPDCNEVVDRYRIAALERECEVRDTTTGELVYPPPRLGDVDEHGRTVVSIGPNGELTFDRTLPPPPPPRDPGRASWV